MVTNFRYSAVSTQQYNSQKANYHKILRNKSKHGRHAVSNWKKETNGSARKRAATSDKREKMCQRYLNKLNEILRFIRYTQSASGHEKRTIGRE